MRAAAARAPPPGTPLEVLLAFTRLGVSSFGGPIAHLGYFRREFVERRAWVSEPTYASLVALCQFLPGPASSQVGFCIGLARAGYAGALAAWAGFTLPSAAAMVAFSYGARALSGEPGGALLHGLRLVAVAVVAQAVCSMARTLCPDRERGAIALLAMLTVLLGASSAAQIVAMAAGALAGVVLCRGAHPGAAEPLHLPPTPRAGLTALAVFLLLLLGLPVVRAATHAGAVTLAESFYRSGALVFGGGHVVLPLLRASVVAPGWVSDADFLSGYGAAQAVPGPLFSFAAYLGAVVSVGPRGIPGAALALTALYLPGLLLLVGALPFWDAIRRGSYAAGAVAGVGAAVVGLLAAALYDPIWTTTVTSRGDFAIAVLGFALLALWRTPPLAVALISAGCSVALARAGA
ncbi:MAG TPA: chromate efflux transporter [Steroidobacteraceae bacterium]|nr:chromate efflux transporter [Steroidobacteraceae bacterium]